MADLVKSITDLLTPDLLQKAAALVGETPTVTQKGLGVAVPTVLSGLGNLASTDTGASQLLGLVNRLGGDGNLLGDLAGFLGGGSTTQGAMSAGGEVLQTIFGGNQSRIIDALASAVGAKSSTTAGSLLRLAVPLVLSMLARYRRTENLDAGGLASLLRGQRSSYAGLLPASISGLMSAAGPTARVAPPPPPPAPSSSPLRWLIPLALLGLVGAWLGSRGCGDTTRQTAQVAERKLSRLTLPGGVNIELPEGSFNYNLARFLGNAADTTLPRTFVFEDLNFETGSAALTPDSRRVVNDLIVIMKAYPTARGQLAGHTDNTGDAAANKTLSEARAKTVRDAMVAGGVDAARLEAAGYGQERPVASNDTDAGRAKNRRTELVILSK
jgi:outer membrane protein OmpA-like peptidoglycan-associated protein